MSKYVVPATRMYPTIKKFDRRVFDTLDEAKIAYQPGLFGAIVGWEGPFNGPFPHCQVWHGYADSTVTGMGPWPPDCIYEIDVETVKEAELLYDQWLYLAVKAEEERREKLKPRVKGFNPLVLEGDCQIDDDGEYLGIRVGGINLIGGIIEDFLDVPDQNRLDGFKFGPVRVTVELLKKP